MRNLGRIILPALAVALHTPSNDRQRQIFNQVLRCVRALVSWLLMTLYPSHTEETLGYMDQYLKDFHKEKDVFLRYRKGKAAEAVATQVRQTLRDEHEAEVRSTQGMTALKKRRLQADQRFELEEAVSEVYRENSHFNFPKIHLMSHFSEHVRRFGSIPQYSTEAGESAHRDQIKAPYRHTNKVDPMLQILTNYNRSHIFAMNEQNLVQIAREGCCTAEMMDVLNLLPPKARRIVNASHREYEDPPENAEICPTSIPYFSDQDQCTKRFVASKDQSTLVCNLALPEGSLPLGDYIKQYYRRELGATRCPDVRQWQVTVFRTLHIPVHSLGLGDESTTHIIRATAGQDFRKRGARSDWAWCKFGAEDQYGSLRGKRPARVLRFLKLRDPSKRRPLLLAVVQPMRPDNGGRPDTIHGMVRVSRPSATGEIWVISIKSITGMAHLIPESSAPNNGRWYVNHTIDLNTFNEIY